MHDKGHYRWRGIRVVFPMILRPHHFKKNRIDFMYKPNNRYNTSNLQFILAYFPFDAGSSCMVVEPRIHVVDLVVTARSHRIAKCWHFNLVLYNVIQSIDVVYNHSNFHSTAAEASNNMQFIMAS